MSVGEYAADARAGVAWLRAPAGGHQGRDPRPLDGRRRHARRDGHRPGRRRGRSPSSAPADPWRLTRLTFQLAHLPIPAPDRVAPRLAHDPGLPPPARPLGRVGQRDARGPDDRGRPCCSSTGRTTPSCRSSHLGRLAPGPPRRAARRRHGDPHRRGRPALVAVRARRLPRRDRAGSSRRSSAVRSIPTRRRASPRPCRPMRLPDPERLTTLDNEPGGLRSLAGTRSR